MKNSTHLSCLKKKPLAALVLLASLGGVQSSYAELLGVSPQRPLISFSGTGNTEFDADQGLFSVNSVPLSMLLPPVRFINNAAAGSKLFDINIVLDSAGVLVSGVPGDDLIITGSVDLDGDGNADANGTLLTGEIAQFGYRDTNTPTDLYDFVFNVTGGELASLYSGYDVAVTMNSEDSNFGGSFEVDFSGKAKGQLGAITKPTRPQIQICTLVTLNPDMQSGMSDADRISGDGCDPLSQGIPVGVVGGVDATYQLQVTNTGTENLVNVVIDSPDFGLSDVNIPATCGMMEPGEVCIIDVDVPNGAFDSLKKDNICQASGEVMQLASVKGEGQSSGILVSDEDPAIVDCTTEPHISLLKEVSLNGSAFMDANTVAASPIAKLGADAVYRLTVTNTGTEALNNVVINDPALGINNVALGVNPLAPGQSVVLTEVDAGFAPLYVQNRCDIVGEILNVAFVEGTGSESGTVVENQDPAYVRCENPQIELQKEVSIDGVNYFDADLADGNDAPVGLKGETVAYYRLIVKNIGTETLTNVLISDAKLGIEQAIADLAPGVTQIIDSGEIGFSALVDQNVCRGQTGVKTNIASVMASGAISEVVVISEDPANVKCITGPAIEIKKQVRMNGGDFEDADLPADAVVGELGDNAVFRLVVINTGDEDLTNVRVSDQKLGIDNVLIANLAVGEQVVINRLSAGFEALQAQGYCDAVGKKLNVAKVKAKGVLTNKPVDADDPAYVQCSAPVQCDISVNQTCAVKPQASDDKLCTASISATTLLYTGPNKQNATVVFQGKDGGSVTYSGVDLVSNVTILTKPSQNGYTVDAGIGQKLGSATTITIDGKAEIIHTSCSAVYVAGVPAPLDGNTPYPANSEKGDPSPLWTVVNFRQKDDVVIDGGIGQQEGAESCSVPFGGAEVSYSYLISNNGDTKVSITGITDSQFGELLNNPPRFLNAGESFTLTRKKTVTESTISTVNVNAEVADNAAVVCPAMDTTQVTVDAAPEYSCADGKPKKLGFTYVGGSCADSNHDQGSKSSCSGNSTGVSPVTLKFMDKKGSIFLTQQVNIGDTVIVDPSQYGKDKFDSETHIAVISGNKVIQSLNIHTSCSAPLEVGDQHGGVVISSFTPDGSGKGKGSKGKGSKGKDSKAKGSKGKDSKSKGSKGKEPKDSKSKGSKGKEPKGSKSKGSKKGKK
jgi:hypothetical protein